MNCLKKRDKKSSGWKRLVALFFSLTVLILTLVWFIRGIKLSQWSNQLWFGVVEQNDGVIVKLYNREEKKLVDFIIPGETMVEVSFGFGALRLGKVAELGELEKKPGLILTRTVQDLLGLPIRGWKIGTKSNLTWWDKARLAWFERFIVTTKERVDLGDSLALQSGFLSDKTRILKVNQAYLDQVVHEQVFDQKLAEESLSVAVLNTSDTDGVALNISRLASNLGIEIRLIGNAVKQTVSIIKVNNEKVKNSKTVKTLSEALGIKTIELDDIFEYRSDIVVMIGQDYTKL